MLGYATRLNNVSNSGRYNRLSRRTILRFMRKFELTYLPHNVTVPVRHRNAISEEDIAPVSQSYVTIQTYQFIAVRYSTFPTLVYGEFYWETLTIVLIRLIQFNKSNFNDFVNKQNWRTMRHCIQLNWLFAIILCWRSYCSMLSDFFCLDWIPSTFNDNMYFQQDGATYHTGNQTINLLKEKFGELIISWK